MSLEISNSELRASLRKGTLNRYGSSESHLTNDQHADMQTLTVISPQTVIHSDPEIMGGTPCFKGTRVPVKNLFDYLEEGESLKFFFEDFPRVTKKQVEAVLELSKQSLLDNL